MALRRCLRSFLTVLVLVLLLALNACAVESPASSSAPSTTAAAPPTPDPRPTPASSKGPARNLPRPVLPESAKQNTKEGFEAFRQYWLNSVTFAFESGDVEPLELASAPTCEVCGEFKTAALRLHDERGWAVGPKWTVQHFSTDMVADPERRFLGRYLGIESPSVDYNEGGSVRRAYPGEPSGTYQEIYARYDSGAWITVETGNL
jgi:hypothetical protein